MKINTIIKKVLAKVNKLLRIKCSEPKAFGSWNIEGKEYFGEVHIVEGKFPGRGITGKGHKVDDCPYLFK